MTDPKCVVVPLLAGPGNPHKGLGGQEQNCSQVTGGGTKQKSLQGTENERDSPGGRRQSGQHPAPGPDPLISEWTDPTQSACRHLSSTY